MSPRNIALIPAAGSGSRFGAAKPKQYLEIGGKTVLQHTLDIFLAHPQIHYTAVILAPADHIFQTASSKRLGIFRVGGASRAQTVRNGLHALTAQGIAAPHDNILVHDAARCCLPPEALTRLIEAAGGTPEGGILAMPVADTLKRGDGANRVAATVPRTALWQAQTPQLFQTALLLRALCAADSDGFTDEASAVEALGIRLQLIEGDARNLKLTLPQDETLVRLLLAAV